MQDQTIGAIYDVIRDVNEKVGTLASDILEKARQRRAPHEVEHAKGRAAGAGLTR